MMRSYIILVILSITISLVVSVSDDACSPLSNTDCKTCLSGPGCAYCSNNKLCFHYTVDQTNLPCKISELKAKTCFASIQTWIIILSVVGGVLLIVIIAIICVICKRCKARSMATERRKEYENDQRLEERKAAAEIRSAERMQAADVIRMKYGLLKEKDSSTPYEKLS